MKAYIDRESGEVWELESDGSQDNYIQPTFELLTDEELAAIRAEQGAGVAPTPEEAAQLAIEKRAELLRKAALVIGPLQDAVDIGEATEDKESQLLLWKRYRIAVSEIDQQDGFPLAIEWPAEPK